MTHTKAKNIKRAYNDFSNSHLYTLYDCYGTFSIYKQRAFNYCRELYEKYNGFSGKIIGFNSQTFSYGFTGTHPDDGRAIFVYITKDYDRYIYIDEI